MAISPLIRDMLFRRADGRCECEAFLCGHPGRCPAELLAGDWEAHLRVGGGSDSLSNLLALCRSCHDRTRSVDPGMLTYDQVEGSVQAALQLTGCHKITLHGLDRSLSGAWIGYFTIQGEARLLENEAVAFFLPPGTNEQSAAAIILARLNEVLPLWTEHAEEEDGRKEAPTKT